MNYDNSETTDHNAVANGWTGIGKTERIRAALAKTAYDESVRQGDLGGFVAVDDVESSSGFIDPKEGGEKNGE